MYDIYLVKDNECKYVAITDGQTVKIFRGDNGVYHHIDLYGWNTIVKLELYFWNYNSFIRLPDYNDIVSDEIYDYSTFKEDADWIFIYSCFRERI